MALQECTEGAIDVAVQAEAAGATITSDIAYGLAWGYTADYSIAKPSNVAVGDFLLAFIISTESNLPTQTLPSGWTILNTGGPIVDGDHYWMICFLRYASGAGPYVWGDLTADTKQTGFIIRLTGIYGTGTTDPLDVAVSIHNDGEYATPATWTSITTVTDGCAILGVAAMNTESRPFSSSSYTERADVSGGIFLMGDIQTTHGATGAKTGTFSGGNSNWATILMALKPA